MGNYNTRFILAVLFFGYYIKALTSSNCEITENSESDVDEVNGRKKRFVVHTDGGWNKTNLTYRIIKYPHDFTLSQRNNTEIVLKKHQMKQAIKKAFWAWSRNSAINFKRDQCKADITVKFGKVDGPGKGAGVAFYPSSGGTITLDVAELWTLKAGGTGLDLFQVAAHMVGHSLGLGHSKNKGAVMNANITYREKWRLTKDDILGMIYLYGA